MKTKWVLVEVTMHSIVVLEVKNTGDDEYIKNCAMDLAEDLFNGKPLDIDKVESRILKEDEIEMEKRHAHHVERN